MRRAITILLIVAAGLLVFTGATAKVFLSIATGGTAGTYYPLGGAMAEIINKAVPNVNATAIATGASVANLNGLAEDEFQMVISQNDVTFYAYTGTELFEKSRAMYNLRGIACLYNETVQIVTLANSGIKTLADLKGKKVVVGAIGSGTEVNARQILAMAGITYDDINEQFQSFGDGANSLRDGNVDAVFNTAGEPTAAVRDIASQKDIYLVPVPADVAKKLIAKYPYYFTYKIPKDTYPKQTEAVETVVVKAMLVVKDSMSNDMAYNITKALFSPAGLERLGLAHAKGKLISKATALDGMSVLLHPGAERFFKEK
jgi:TRAP transporter TAXI family solute receptor